MRTADYDAVLVSKVLGSQEKKVVMDERPAIFQPHTSFEADYYSNQDVYHQQDKVETYTLYHAQSVLYCICPDKAHKTIWRASIDVDQLDSKKKAIKDYLKMLLWTLEDQDVLIVDKND